MSKDRTESENSAIERRPTMTATDPVQAVAEALHADQCPDDECDGGDMGEWERQAEVAVDAARPLIEREAKAEAWGEGYRLGVNDERMSQESTDGEVPAGRINPYRQEADDARD